MPDKAVDPSGLRGSRSPYAEARICVLQSGSGNIVKVIAGLLFRFSRPEIEIRFVPNFKIPLRHLLDAVSLYKVTGELENELVPLARITRWRNVRVIPEWVRAGSLGHLFRHEAEFNKGTDSDLHQAVIDEVNASEVQRQIARSVLTAVDSYLMFKNPMKPDVLYVHDFSERAQILAPIFTEGHGGMAG